MLWRDLSFEKGRGIVHDLRSRLLCRWQVESDSCYLEVPLCIMKVKVIHKQSNDVLFTVKNKVN